MELEVRRVSGERTCFVALPLQVIYLLQESGNVLPSFLVLDIRLAVKNKETAPWYLAWAGASSKSQSIEVPDKLAECIGLPHGVKVRMKVQKNVFEAKSVAVEPATEDDWEILELNAEYLENHILSKVGVVQESQCFPVWVQGETVLILKVISTKPKAVVKLVQGTELIVAPKNRQSRTVPPEDVSAYKGKNALQAADPYYRIQEMDPSIVCSFQSGVDGISVMLTTALFISPLSAKKVSFTDRQLVVLAGPDVGKAAHSNIRKDSGSQELLHNDLKQELAVEENTEKERGMRRVVLQVIFWSGVARGHIMLPYPLQLFLGVKTHSRVKLRPYDHPAKELPSSVWICPVKLTTNRSWLSSEVGGMTGDMKSNTPKNVKELDRNMAKNGNVIDKNWSKHAKVLASAASRNNSLEIDDHEGVNHIKSKDPKALLSFWLAAQWAACSQLVPDNSAINIPVSIETIMCFEVNNIKRTHMEDEHVQSAKLTENHISSDAHHRPVSSYIHRKKRPQCQSVYFLLTMQSDKIISSSYKSVPQHQSETEPQNLCFLLHHHFLAGVHPNVDTRAETNNTVEVQIGQPRFLVCRNEISERDSPSLDSMSWLRKPALEVLARLKVLLSPTACEDMRKLGTPYPGGVLLHGPQACGKTRLALAVARELEKDVEVLAHRVMLGGAELLGEQDQVVRCSIQNAVVEAVQHAPSLVILDDLDALVPVANAEGSEPSTSVLSLAEFLSDIIDASQQVGCLHCIGPAPIAFLATSRAPSAIPLCLHTSGRLDCYVELPAPAITERAAILQHAVETRGLTCDQNILEKVAASCDGYDNSDLEVLLDRSVHAAAARFITYSTLDGLGSVMDAGSRGAQTFSFNAKMSDLLPLMQNKRFELLNQDFDNAVKNFVPAAMRGISKGGKEGKCGGWEDVGGLSEVRQVMQEVLELPLKHGKLFSNAPLRLRSGVLLYGPPGCGKTHIVSAAAAAASLRFISVKGPELLNKYIGASEQAVRDIFTKAATAAPCILFFDEFDAIAPRRGHDNTGVTDRVVNQLLTELDGVEALNGVFVVAATSRPDLIDGALLRPGRLDRLLYCDFPSYQERLEILQVLGRKLPLEADVDLHLVAEMTEGFSGADLQAVLSDAQLESVHSFLDAEESGKAIVSPENGRPRLTMPILRSAAMKARPSVSEAERRRLANIYTAFFGGKSPGSSKQMQDIKGKKATLA